MGDEIRGGEALVTVRIAQKVTTFKFQIRGTQPSDTAVEAAIGLTLWYAIPIAKHETFKADAYYNQFNEGTNNPAIDGTPNASNNGDRGYGIFQLTNPAPTPQELWSWKANVADGLRRLNQMAAQADSWMNAPATSVKPGQRIQAAADIERCNALQPMPSGCTATVPNIPTLNYGTKCIFRDEAGAAQTFEDAVAIKMYNGAKQGNFVSWKNALYTWEFNEEGNVGENYVRDVCEDWDK